VPSVSGATATTPGALGGLINPFTRHDEKGRPIDVCDPLALRLMALADEAGPVAARLAPTLFSIRNVFGTDLPADPRFTLEVEAALDQLFTIGSRATVIDCRRLRPSVHAIPINSRIATDTNARLGSETLRGTFALTYRHNATSPIRSKPCKTIIRMTNSVLSIYSCRK
jgi:hypothetical protein